MNISVVGTGYVGLVTGTGFAETGNMVTCIDTNPDKVAQMQAGETPIFEPGLQELMRKNSDEGRLRFTTELEVEDAEAIFLALPTPPEEDGSADLSYVLGAAKDIGGLLTKYAVVVTKSTVPVGTARKVHDHLGMHATADYDVVSNPEFLREGQAVNDFMRPDRVVIGTDSERAADLMRHLYRPYILQRPDRLQLMSPASAELAKYAANTLLANKITFMNVVSRICDATGANIDDVRRSIGADKRIGTEFLWAGLGYGGSCFPKDVRAIGQIAAEHNVDSQLFTAITELNNSQRLVLPEKVEAYYGGELEGKTFAVWGLAFKPETDDIREAPALDIIKGLTEKGAKIVAYDPEAMDNVAKHLGISPNVSFAGNEYDALEGADALIIATEWRQFRNPDFARMRSLLAQPVVFDGRNVFSLSDMQEHGFYYDSIGRPKVEAS